MTKLETYIQNVNRVMSQPETQQKLEATLEEIGLDTSITDSSVMFLSDQDLKQFTFLVTIEYNGSKNYFRKDITDLARIDTNNPLAYVFGELKEHKESLLDWYNKEIAKN